MLISPLMDKAAFSFGWVVLWRDTNIEVDIYGWLAGRQMRRAVL